MPLNPFLEESTYNPVHSEDGTALDLDANLDEFATAAGRQADECAAVTYWPAAPGVQFFKDRARLYRIRQLALLTAFYVEYELRNEDGNHAAVLEILADLEHRTCPEACRELRELLEGLR